MLLIGATADPGMQYRVDLFPELAATGQVHFGCAYNKIALSFVERLRRKTADDAARVDRAPQKLVRLGLKDRPYIHRFEDKGRGVACGSAGEDDSL